MKKLLMIVIKRDASNDPVTGTCEFAAGVSVTGLTILQQELMMVCTSY